LQEPSELLEKDLGYSQVSPAAIVALLFGLASPLAFVGPVFFVFPAVAVGVALIALGKIRASGGALTGETLARAAIALGVGCIAASLARTSVRDTLMQRQAAAAAREWLELLADGRLSEAGEMLTSDGAHMFIPSPGPGGPGVTADEAEELVTSGLRSNALTKAVTGQENPGVVERVEGPVFDGQRATVALTLGVEDSTEGGHRHIEMQVIRSPAYEAQGRAWRVDRWQTGEAHAAH
jgi:hypothetical protein